MSLLANSNAIESGGYNIDRSLRFRSSASAYLSRTPASAGSRTTWTWSGWLKIGKVGQTITLFKAGVTNDSDNRAEFTIDSSGIIYFYSADSAVTKNYVISNQVFRDPSAWYHLICVYDSTNATSSNRVKMYVNGSQITSLSGATYAAQNTTTVINNNVFHVINYNNYSSGPVYGDGYLAEVNFIDGQALTPSSFGQTDAVTGVWVPKKYTGTYGTNGFYLDFKDNTSATTLAYDKSGNGNNWTANNISTTAGATYDSMTDVPTLTSATAANFATLNPLRMNGTVSLGASQTNGNLNFASSSAYKTAISTFGMNAGKWYFEASIYANYNSSDSVEVGLEIEGNPAANHYIGYDPNGVTTGYGYQANTGYLVGGTGGGNDQTGAATFTTGDIIGVTYDADAGTAKWYKNNVLQYTKTGLSGQTWFFAVSSYSYGPSNIATNFGQRPFAYTPPTGFKALNTFNLPDPVIKKPNQYMDVLTYTGTGSLTTRTGLNLISPVDLVWIKSRSAAQSHVLEDSVRGTGYVFADGTNSTNAEGATGGGWIQNLSKTGFSTDVNGNINTNGATYVAWNWVKGATAGFDIVTYTGDGTNRNISHNLGVAPSMIIVKSRNATNGWYVCHVGSWGGDGNGLFLNNTASTYNRVSDLGGTGITAMTSSYFTATTGSGTFLNTTSTTYVAYLFAEIPGFSKFGSYTGNGSTDGPFVYCGFRPKYVMIKKYTAGTLSHWRVTDSSRSTYNVTNEILAPSSSAAEFNETECDFLSNGFKLRLNTTYSNGSGEGYIFAAFAENPFKYSLAR